MSECSRVKQLLTKKKKNTVYQGILNVHLFNINQYCRPDEHLTLYIQLNSQFLFRKHIKNTFFSYLL